MKMMLNSLDATFALDAGPAFEPDPDDSMAARIERAGADVHEVLYDTMCELAVTERCERLRTLSTADEITSRVWEEVAIVQDFVTNVAKSGPQP